ncbi:Nse1 non-SMC component of SMC5-6 complex-domain-containing protein [Epithele typhae]|uniref:Nse1 non-SMC component of SMC5-6 complex-domain-containing protein n=1 Tax=Epithele typhae TaxID=378194 RepID=UPI0020083CD4|nr:Nse1 non-SMC component of SMC5-6 complex-domain-containing protein [Epithele typhae]KAH9946016.1 Nse1 non-SMC component of SMC5-6 complex-domain-containing protein [Epithele typhae]
MTVHSGDVQRLFIQAVISRRVLSQRLAATIWKKCIEATKAANETLSIQYRDDRASWDTFVTSINDTLNLLDLEFAHLHDEGSGKELYAIVNRKGDEIAQMATEYSALEIAYFKAVVEQIMLAPNESFCVSSLAALRETNSLKTSSMTKSQAESTLGSFVANGWLVKSRQGRYSLSTRTVMELQTYLRQTYEDQVVDCTICMELVTRGVACPTPQCKTRLHPHCLTTYRRRTQACPTCKENWSSMELRPVGEVAFKEGQDQMRQRVRRQTSAEEDEDVDDEGEVYPDSDGEADGGNAGPSQPNSKGKGKKARESTMDVEDRDSPQPQKRKARR